MSTFQQDREELAVLVAKLQDIVAAKPPAAAAAAYDRSPAADPDFVSLPRPAEQAKKAPKAPKAVPSSSTAPAETTASISDDKFKSLQQQFDVLKKMVTEQNRQTPAAGPSAQPSAVTATGAPGLNNQSILSRFGQRLPIHQHRKAKVSGHALTAATKPARKVKTYGFGRQKKVFCIPDPDFIRATDENDKVLSFNGANLAALEDTVAELELIAYPNIPEDATGSEVQNTVMAAFEGKIDLEALNYKYYKVRQGGNRALVYVAGSTDLGQKAVCVQYRGPHYAIIVTSRAAPGSEVFREVFLKHVALGHQNKNKKERAVSEDTDSGGEEAVGDEDLEPANPTDPTLVTCGICQGRFHRDRLLKHQERSVCKFDPPRDESAMVGPYSPRGNDASESEGDTKPIDFDIKPKIGQSNGLSETEAGRTYSDYAFTTPRKAHGRSKDPADSPSPSKVRKVYQKPNTIVRQSQQDPIIISDSSDSSDDEAVLDMRRQNKEFDRLIMEMSVKREQRSHSRGMRQSSNDRTGHPSAPPPPAYTSPMTARVERLELSSPNALGLDQTRSPPTAASSSSKVRTKAKVKKVTKTVQSAAAVTAIGGDKSVGTSMVEQTKVSRSGRVLRPSSKVKN